MATFLAAYIAIDGVTTQDVVGLMEGECDALNEKCFIRRHEDHPWIQVQLSPGDWDALEGVAERLSSRLRVGTVMMASQTSVDAFIYRSFDAGQPRRTLRYGCDEERVWEEASGEPEAWEDAVFFEGEAVDELLSERTCLQDLRYVCELRILVSSKLRQGS